jgi:hypothetical protein
VDPNVPVVTNAAVRIGVIPSAATRCAVILFAARIVVLNVAPTAETPSVVSQAARGDFLNAAVLRVVLNAVRDVARDVVIPFAVTQSVRYAVTQCVADPDARVDSQDEVLPNDAQGVFPAGLQNLVAVQSEVAPFSAPSLA